LSASISLMPGIRLTQSLAITQSSILPGVRMKAQGRQSPSNYRMNLAVAAALGNPDRLKIRPHFRRWNNVEPSPAAVPTQPARVDCKALRQTRRSFARCPARSSARSDYRRTCAGRIPSGTCPRQPTVSTCMMPLRIRRSYLRSGPGWFVGKCGTIFAHCSSVNQTKFASLDLASSSLTKRLNQNMVI
jgi:hypothetical protein